MANNGEGVMFPRFLVEKAGVPVVAGVSFGGGVCWWLRAASQDPKPN